MRTLAALCALIALSCHAKAQPVVDAEGVPPELAIAVAVDASTLEVHRFIERAFTRTTSLPPGLTIKVEKGSIVPAIEAGVVVETHITRVRIADIVARHNDGRAIPASSLTHELAKPTPVAITYSGHQVAPQFWKMFKPESVILQLGNRARVPVTSPAGVDRSKPK